MDPITIGAAIGAAKAAVGTAKSIQELSHSLQDLRTAETDYNEKKRNKRKKLQRSVSGSRDGLHTMVFQ